MSSAELQLSEEKYLFTFQDETKLWIPKEFIEKYRQFPFYDIIEHTNKYEDDSYYIDMLPFHIEKVISFLMDKNVDMSSLNLKNSYDIYQTLVDYSVTIDKGIQNDLLIHIKGLFYNFLKDNNYNINGYNFEDIESHMPMEMFSLEEKGILINGLFTPQRKDELFYYSLLIKMINITKVKIEYDYASNIPVEYICPSCIKDIFPSLKELIINVNSRYKKTKLLLNPNSDEYIMEYIQLFSIYDYTIKKPEKYEYYTESEMNDYNKISSLDLNHLYYSHDLIESYNKRREKNELPKLYKHIVDEAIYTNDYSQVKTNKTEEEYTLDDEVSIQYDEKTNDKTFIIDFVFSEHGISQLLLLPSYLFISKNVLNFHYEIDSMFFMKLFEEGLFDFLTVLSVYKTNELIQEIDKNLFNKVITTHVFPNVIELIYDEPIYNDEPFKLSLIKKECFPKLHIINYKYEITTDNFESLFPVNLMSMIDTIRINEIDLHYKEEIALLLDNLIYTHSIHIYENNDLAYYFPHLNELLSKSLVSIDNLFIDSSCSEKIKLLDSIENYKQNIDSLNIEFKNDHHNEIDIRSSLERLLKSSVLEHLNYLTISFNYDDNIEYLMWVSTLFNDNQFNSIHELTIDLYYIQNDSSSEYLTVYENIMMKLFPKASFIKIKNCTLSFINRLIPKGCFHNTTELYLRINDIPDEDFFRLYTTDNLPQLKYIRFYKFDNKWWNSFIETFCIYINNNNFPSSSIVQLNKAENNHYYDYIIDANTSFLRCKQETNSFMNIIIGTEDKEMSKFEIETLFDCINENKTQNIRSLTLYIYDKDQLSKLINFINTGKFPKLKEFYFNFSILDEQIDIYKQQLNDSSFIQENHVNYLVD
ncbi:hypothetical protein WA158_003010 [Blastocystis sp. Blastoise]